MSNYDWCIAKSIISGFIFGWIWQPQKQPTDNGRLFIYRLHPAPVLATGSNTGLSAPQTLLFTYLIGHRWKPFCCGGIGSTIVPSTTSNTWLHSYRTVIFLLLCFTFSPHCRSVFLLLGRSDFGLSMSLWCTVKSRNSLTLAQERSSFGLPVILFWSCKVCLGKKGDKNSFNLFKNLWERKIKTRHIWVKHIVNV